MPDLAHDRPAVSRTSRLVPLSTPRRICAAVERLRRKHVKARSECGLMFGAGPLVTALDRRITAVADAARLDDMSVSNGWCVTSAARLMQGLAGMGRAVSRLHDLVWSLAACQCIEAEDRYAASVAVHLAGMIGEVERINAALEAGEQVRAAA